MHARHLMLALILLVYLALATLYAVNVPAWQAPDEPAHFNYIHELAATGQIPVLRMGDYDEGYIQQLTGQRFPPDLSTAPLRYEAHQPPLHYLLGAGIFRLTGGDLLPLRLLSLALGALFIGLIYAIVRLVFPGQPALALGAAAFTAFLPMHVAQAASVNNDALAEVLLAAILLLSICYVKLTILGPRFPGAWDALAIGLLLGLALVTKVSAYVAIPAALAAPLIAWYEDKPSGTDHRSPVTAYLLILLPALLIALPWYVRNAQVYGHLDILARSWHDQVVVGQLTTGELLAQAGLAAVLERFLVWSHSSFWGVFGWMGVWMDARVYTAALAFGLAVAAGCLWQVMRRNTTANEDQRMASGKNTTANEEQRMAGGQNTTTNEEQRMAGGQNTTTNEEQRMASGKNTTANEDQRIASGKNTTANEERRMAGGQNTTTNEEQRMADAAEGADLDALVTDHRSPITDHRLPMSDHRSRFRRWALALLGLSALGTLSIYLAYNLQFVQPQGRYLFPALPLISLTVAVGWWTVARWPGAARMAALALLAAAGAAMLWGVTQEGVNKWSLLIFGGGAGLLWAWSLVASRLRDIPRHWASIVLYALPFALMAVLSALALWMFILPQLR